MIKEELFNDYFGASNKYLRNVSVDNVIFGYHEKELKVLLQHPLAFEKWTLTGGYIKRTESIQEAADRVAQERTGLSGLFLQQFSAFGNPERVKYDKDISKNLSQLSGMEVPKDAWFFDYFVSVGYYTLTEFSKVSVKISDLEQDCAWWPVNELPPLAFDHELIIKEALNAMRVHIAHYPVGYELLEEKFTLPEIHSLYETILGKTLDDRNFAKRLTATGIIIKLNETKKIGAHRSPYLYMFDKEKYEAGLKSGVDLVF